MVLQEEERLPDDNSCSRNNSEIFDRLPDDVLIHILSMLPTRDCVESSILGKRWRLLWARVPNLKFHRRDHKTMSSFVNFFNRFVFVHKGHTINTFNIEFSGWKDDNEYISETETLITTAIACNVQVIVISTVHDLVLPHECLFTCKTLVDLTIDYYCEGYDSPPMVPIPTTGTSSSVVCLPALKKLKLGYVKYETAKTLVHLLSGCPAIEELTIITNKDDVLVDCVFVSSPTLTRLNLQIYFWDYYYKVHEVKIDTPVLKYLTLSDSSSQNFSIGMLASLTEADVAFNKSQNSRSILEFVSKLNNVSFLKLRICFEVPGSAWNDSTLTRTEFRNLTELELAGKWRLLTTFLEKFDNLKVLSVDMLPVDKHEYWTEPKQVPMCLKNHLRSVCFFHFECSDPELNMVKYVLKHAKVLTMMDIRVRRDLKKEKKALERITLFERASEACLLHVC